MADDVWNVLVVDDDEDIHAVTKLALSRFQWKNKKIKVTSALSGIQARRILTAPESPRFEVALIDVVMETPDAGIELCVFIRSLPSRVTRLILRTGQPGKAPEPQMLEEHPIDFYLAKGQATQEFLTAVIRACLQASEDMKVAEKKA